MPAELARSITKSTEDRLPAKDDVVLRKLRSLIAEGAWAIDRRLPPERELALTLGVSRSDLRKALAILEAEGQIWRHVGKGTFVGTRPIDALFDISAIANQTNPAEVLRTRLILEPQAARLAALYATPAQISEMRACLSRTRSAETFQQYVHWDSRLHQVIGEATRNTLLTGLLDVLSAVRRAVVWGRLREKESPRTDNPSLVEHERIVDAIENRESEAAAVAMHDHLERVERVLLPKPYWP